MTDEQREIYKWLNRLQDEIIFIKWAGLLIFAISGATGFVLAMALN